MTKFTIGIDEAGRGPLAGPVAVGIIKIENSKIKNKISNTVPKNFIKENFPDLKDSKKLSEKRREEIFEQIKKLKKEGKLSWAVALVSERLIDKKGINAAIKTGIKYCLSKVEAQSTDTIKLDGSLSAPEEFLNQKTIIKGDETVPVISLASICAKVMRDRYMKKISLKFPEYRFEKHKGYGTIEHINMIKNHGLSTLHRRTFCKFYGF